MLNVVKSVFGGKRIFLVVIGLLIGTNFLYGELNADILEQIWDREVVINMEYSRVDSADTLNKEERLKLGNGVLLNSNLILTAGHILEIDDLMINPEITIFIWMIQKEIKIDFTDIYLSEEKDMAFIHLKNALPIEPVIMPKNQLNLTEKVYSPMSLIDDNCTFFSVILSYQVAGFLTNGYILDKIGPRGMSGGGIYNKKAELSGLAISVKHLGDAPFLLIYNTEAIRDAYQKMMDKNPFKQGKK